MWHIFLTLVYSSSVDLINCEDSCHKSGECHEVYPSEIPYNDTSTALYICKCYEGFTGSTCSECEFGKYGPSCTPCPTHNSLICAGRGICGMGKEGLGLCTCYQGYDSETNCEEETNFLHKWHLEAQFMTFFLLSLVFCILLMHLIHKMPKQFLPSSFGAIVLGIILGFLLKYQFSQNVLSSAVAFDPQVFFLVILPPIMLDAGLSLQHSSLISNLGTILVFGIPGTILTALLFAGGLYGVSYFFAIFELNLIECLLFGTLVSALDPVATLTIFRAMNLESDLQSIVLGESVFNDAVAITMFKILHHQADLDLLNISFQFFYVLLGSAVIGILFGLANTLVFKHCKLKSDSSIELSLFILLTYLPFLLCEAFGLSGILCLLFVGMTSSLYTLSWLSSQTKKAVIEGFSVFSYLSECFCFMYLGISISARYADVVLSMVICSIVLMLLSRGLVVFTFSGFSNKFRANKIGFTHQCLIWVSGMRGAVAFSLALSFPFGNPDLIISTTQYIILFTMLCVSFGIYPILKGLKFIDQLSPMIRASVSVMNFPELEPSKANWFEYLHSNYMVKVFKNQILIGEGEGTN